MAKDTAFPQSALPPYFNIDPDTALAELEAPTSTGGEPTSPAGGSTRRAARACAYSRPGRSPAT
jgi:chromosome partitioning protein